MFSMNKEDNKNLILPIIIMGSFFVIIHGLALPLTNTFFEEGMQVFEDQNDPFNIAYILVIMLVFTLVILLIAKYWKKQIIQILMVGAIGYTMAFVFYPLYAQFLTTIIAAALSVISAGLLVFILLYYPEWYVIDITGIFIGIGAIAIFGISLGVFITIILLIALAIYDAISVYKTKHMIDLADTVIDLKLPVLLVVPKIRNYSLIKETKRLKQKLEENEERDAFFMGLGDIVMPGILVAATYQSPELGLPIAISVIIGTLVGFSILMTFVVKGNPQAGLPLLCGGAISGYIISSLVFYGNLTGLILPTL